MPENEKLTKDKDRIHEIIETVMKVGQGDFSVQIEISDKNDEIDSLAMGINMMIDDIRESHEELKKSEENLFATLTSIGDAVIATGAEGNISFMNPVAERLTGWTQEEAVEKDIKEVFCIVNEETGEKVENPVTRVLREGKVVGLANHTILAAKNGTRIPIDDSGAPIKDDKGNIKGVVLVFRDITQRKILQERLARQEKLAVLGQLAGGVGHELRNPLGVIKNAAYFLNMALETRDPKVKESLELLENEVAASERIISSLLDFARAKPPLRRKVDIHQILRKVLSRVNVPENIEVEYPAVESLPQLLTDPDQLDQVFGNIILNAIQAMPGGGRLMIKSEIQKPGWLAVSIADTGGGIAKENIEKIFEPLFTGKAKGIGLGMAITKTFVEGLGGTIDVNSKIGQGTTFSLKLPIHKK